MIQKMMVTDCPNLTSVLEKAKSEDFIGFDIETRGLEPYYPIVGVSFYLPKAAVAVYVPLDHINYKASDEILDSLKEFLAGFPVKTFNGGYDTCRWEIHFGKSPKIVGDATIVSKMLQLHKFGMKDLAQELGITESPIHLEDILGSDNYDFRQASLDQKTLEYTTQDAILAVQVEEGLLSKFFKSEHHPGWSTVYPLELGIMTILEKAKILGLPVDREKFNVALIEMEQELDQLTDEICQELGRNRDTFKINSSKQLAGALFNSPDQKLTGSEKSLAQTQIAMAGLGLESPTTSKSVADDVLSQLEDQHPVITKIRRWKSLHAVITRDLPQLQKYAATGVLHPEFVQIGEDGTSRIYSKSPNAISLSMSVRKAMPPNKGKVYVHCDYKAAEFRLGALLSGEQKILDALDAGIDPHNFTYNQMTGIPLDKITEEQREYGKVLNYASMYGASAFRIARTLQCTEREAQKQLDYFWQAYSILSAWFDERQEYAKNHARTFTVLGRSRDLRAEIFVSGTSKQKQKVLRRSVNTASQGSCGDVLKLALRNIASLSREPNHPLQLAKTEIKCPVFDAVLLEMDERAMDDDCRPIAEAAIKEAMEFPLEYQGRKTTLRISIGWSKNSWAEACGKG